MKIAKPVNEKIKSSGVLLFEALILLYSGCVNKSKRWFKNGLNQHNCFNSQSNTWLGRLDGYDDLTQAELWVFVEAANEKLLQAG